MLTNTQFSLAALMAVVTAAAIVAWGWKYIVPNIVYLISDGHWLLLAAIVGIVVFVSFSLVRSLSL